MKPKNEKKSNLLPRPPIVVVMGHVDHGKTTLLDYIRNTRLAIKEAGGITQSIGAYEIIHESSGVKRKITFIDTPGHEAFSRMRERGATVADLAILVVAADDGVQPQTKESITTLKKTETPFVVAINKIDAPDADIERVKSELAQSEVFLEGYGGDISWQAISAKKGDGIKELLDLLLLAADLESLEYDPSHNTEGVIIEVTKEATRGTTAVLIVKNGTLKRGDFITTESGYGRVKILENFMGKAVTELAPSSPAQIIGWEKSPKIGEEFFAGPDAKVHAPSASSSQFQKLDSKTKDSKNINVVIKADTSGSLEALTSIIHHIKVNEKGIDIIDSGIGDISENDVKNALLSQALIIGFRIKINKDAENLLHDKKDLVITSEIIYDLTKRLEDMLREIQKPITGDLEILALFGDKTGVKKIVGGKMTKGIIASKNPLEVFRNGKNIGTAKIINLQHNRKDIAEVKEGKEAGLLIESTIAIREGDHLVVRL
ncbi:MAG: translation initiation factor IF-2 [Candidatus Harrisonbacteria bacterium RIFOXYD1_FULL_40_9]|uniref:Translation initiation factor IF-2 n=1 Tax=Candidatus Harrisonbacteria bacterium RIFOXYD1_FULL_40_9 TaxID=1798412 RepID=A0A1G1ZW33_9BACT|nr:MAG: translation initiation factor IF-2 [Candidatus Harrisonbacteria bacterium RIFOXYD1_FULL_40_9]